MMTPRSWPYLVFTIRGESFGGSWLPFINLRHISSQTARQIEFCMLNPVMVRLRWTHFGVRDELGVGSRDVGEWWRRSTIGQRTIDSDHWTLWSDKLVGCRSSTKGRCGFRVNMKPNSFSTQLGVRRYSGWNIELDGRDGPSWFRIKKNELRNYRH